MTTELQTAILNWAHTVTAEVQIKLLTQGGKPTQASENVGKRMKELHDAIMSEPIKP